MIFTKMMIEVVDGDGIVLLNTKREKDLYHFQDLTDPECKKIFEADITARAWKKNYLEVWHIHIGHLNFIIFL